MSTQDDHLFVKGKWVPIRTTAATVATINGNVSLVICPGLRRTIRLVGGVLNQVAAFNVRNAQHATGSVTLSSTGAADTNTVALNDGVNPVQTFEFDNNASITGGNVAVTIGSGGVTTLTALSDQAQALANAINSIGASFGITAEHIFGSAVVTLRNDLFGTVGNQAITVVGANLAKSDLAGGTVGAAASQLAIAAATGATVALPLNPGGYLEGAEGESLVLNAGAATSGMYAQYVEIPTA